MGEKNVRLLVTGGAGFIGANLVEYLLQDATIERVVNLDALTYSGNLDNVSEFKKDPRHVFVHGSIADTERVSQIFREHRLQAVLHLAAETHVDRSIDSPEPFIATNIHGTFALLETVRRYRLELGREAQNAFRFHHISTDEVFGSLGPSDAPFCEKTPYDPRSPYSASKAASDHLVRSYFHTYGLPILITNCSNNYGPHQFPEKLIPLLILNALEDRPLPIYGDGQQRRDWLYVRDHARALDLVLRRGTPGETYTLGGESEVSNLEIVRQICAILDAQAPRPDGQSHRTRVEHVTDRPGHDRRYAISIAKIERELGWKPQESLRSGLEQTVAWYLAHPEWCAAIAKRGHNREHRLGIGVGK